MISFLHRRVPLALGIASLLGVFAACDGSSPKTGDLQSRPPGRVNLVGVSYGRLVDVYAYRVIDAGGSQARSATFNRERVLIERNVAIGPGISSQPLFDASGQVRTDANYRFLPFDVSTGHDELLILWDDSDPAEAERFSAALDRARSTLAPVSDAYRGQSTGSNPIPVVPRNAAIVLEFDNAVGVDTDFFRVNPGAVQILEFRSDPSAGDPAGSFRPLVFRPVPKGNTLILDTTVIGGESTGQASNGLPLSSDQVTANLRVALPSRGAVSGSFFVESDPVADFNGIDSRGRTSVIRDFRSGNQADGGLSSVADLEPPLIVGDLDMGIKAVDTNNRILTITKRFGEVVVRGRVPFVDGALGPNGLPRGPGETPARPLRHGDVIYQTVSDNQTGDSYTLRAEVLENLALRSDLGDPNLGLSPTGEPGADIVEIQVRVSNVSAIDSDGREWTFQGSTLPLGEDCTVRSYFYSTLTINGVETGDAGRVEQFLVVDPKAPTLLGNQPVPIGTRVSPMARLALRFSEPMDLESVDQFGNYFISNDSINGTDVVELMAEPKVAALSVQAARKFDVNRDGTLLRLVPPLGLTHENGTAESYWLHLLLGAAGPRDLGGNQVSIFDSVSNPSGNFSVQFTLDPDAATNLIASRVFRFEDADEDGTKPGSVDFFGQFLLRNGSLTAAPTVRFSRVADNQNLGGITRGDRGECVTPPVDCTPGNTWADIGPVALRYQAARQFEVLLPNAVPVPFQTDPRVGRVIEPHQPQGSRLQMVYIEDDFSLGYKDAANFMIDVEQMYWSTFADDEVLFDSFDRYSLSLAHSDKRPDQYVFETVDAMGNPICALSAQGQRSGLDPVFQDNVLRGTQQVEVVSEVVYTINPNSALRDPTSTNRYIPYPKFQTSYTWRDDRLVTWDMATDAAVGLGGARDPAAPTPNDDFTASIDSPWTPDSPGWREPATQAAPPAAGDCYPAGKLHVVDIADFRGDRQRDHNPIALPLLMDWSVFPDDPGNGVAQGANAFQVAMMGPNSAFGAGDPAGYYNQNFVGPFLRVHSSGGRNPITQIIEPLDPSVQSRAQGGFIYDAGLGAQATGLFPAPAGDSMINWARTDFVRKVSSVTFGFFDTLRPNQHALVQADLSNLNATWSGFTSSAGYPNLDGIGGTLGVDLRASDIVTLMDPPLAEQPAGTNILMELRGAETFANDTLYNPDPDDPLGDLYSFRGNLLNPNYACEAYRYAMPAAGFVPEGGTPRVAASGLTPYVTAENLDQVRDGNGLLPRYMNMRLIMENNTAVEPAVSPSLKGAAIIYRVSPR